MVSPRKVNLNQLDLGEFVHRNKVFQSISHEYVPLEYDGPFEAQRIDDFLKEFENHPKEMKSKARELRQD